MIPILSKKECHYNPHKKNQTKIKIEPKKFSKSKKKQYKKNLARATKKNLFKLLLLRSK